MRIKAIEIAGFRGFAAKRRACFFPALQLTPRSIMSSSELETIFDNAAGTIALRLKDVSGVRTVLNAVRERFLSENHDPLENRKLIIEPPMLSQQLRVSRGAVEAVVEELHRFNLVHVWARAICPLVESDDDNVIVETDDSKAFKEAMREVCPHCGQNHSEMDWSAIETFYAVHVNDVIICGHTRFKAAQKLGLEKVPVRRHRPIRQTDCPSPGRDRIP